MSARQIDNYSHYFLPGCLVWGGRLSTQECDSETPLSTKGSNPVRCGDNLQLFRDDGPNRHLVPRATYSGTCSAITGTAAVRRFEAGC